jgi:hypothetical protein
MTGVPETTAVVSPLLTAAVLLLGRMIGTNLGLPLPTVSAILEATGASRSRAYELCRNLRALLPTLGRPPGRPAAARSEPEGNSTETEQVTREALDFVMRHPGCVHTGRKRAHYGQLYRRFVLETRERHPEIELADFAVAARVPLGTLKDWLRTPEFPEQPEPSDGAGTTGTTESTDAASTHIETVLTIWSKWYGTFSDFCHHLWEHWRVPLGRTSIAHILAAHGVRFARRRPGRSPDELALRGAFETFFPGAQWQGDGSPITVMLGGERFSFNLELMVDSASDAFVGISVRDTEDSTAVAESFSDGVAATTEAPLALLLDNRPSNHTPEVDAALGDTLRIRATPERPQNKPHCEGGFGLFQQTVPPLDVELARGTREAACQILILVAQTFFRAMNGRPRPDRQGRSRIDLYADKPTPEQIQQARAALLERQRQQELARKTLEARQRPEVRTLLDEAFENLHLVDPERHVRLAIARYPLDPIVDGIAILDAKVNAGTLPDGADPARYLLGIVRNVSEQRERELVTEALLRRRVALHDRLLAGLIVDRDQAACANPDPAHIVPHFTDRAVAAERHIDRQFWLMAAADFSRTMTLDLRQAIFRLAACRVNAAYHVSHRDRLDMIRYLADRMVPLS